MSKEFVLQDKDFKYLASFINEKTGIVLAEHKKNMVYTRLARRLRALELKTFKEYCSVLDGNEDEVINLVNAITTNVTKFFREDHHFDHLKNEVIKPLVASSPSPKKLRIWSAGCSSGMETYSIAMTVNEAIPNIGAWDAKILATDIDTNMLRTGKNGEYDAEHLENIPAQYRKKYTVRVGKKEDGRIMMSDSIKNLIGFKKLNLLEPWPIKGPFDVIFCRNVVIYFDKDTQRVLFDKYANMLKPGGWLYIGHSESLHNVSSRFDLKGRTIYQKIQ